VQQALPAALGKDRLSLRLHPVLLENMSFLGTQGFKLLTDPFTVQPGDVMVLDPLAKDYPGHVALVFDALPLTDEQVDAMSSIVVPKKPQDRQEFENQEELRKFLSNRSGQPIPAVAFDSSWGGYGSADVGGPGRREFYFSNGQWLWFTEKGGSDPDGTTGTKVWSVSRTPQGEPLKGFYRAPGGSDRGVGRQDR
jgi:hypothetical protein